MTALGEVLELAYGKALRAADRAGGNIPVVGSGGVAGYHNVGLTDGPTIVVGRKGTIGSVTWIGGSAWPIDTAYYVRADAKLIDARWTFWMLRSLQLENMNKAAAIPGLNRDDVYRRNVHVPPLTEQRRIAVILDQAEALRAKRRQVLAHLDNLSEPIFEETFAGLTFELLRAGDVMPTMRNGLSPAAAGTYRAKILTLSAITRGLFRSSEVKSGFFAVDPAAEKRVSSGDFLICRGNGNKALVGVGAYSPRDRPDLVFPDTIIAGTVDTDLVTMPFIEAAWARREVRSQIEAVARTTNGTYKVNQKTLAGILLPVPPIGVQEEFGAKIASVSRQRSLALRRLEVHDELFASIQSRAFRGEL